MRGGQNRRRDSQIVGVGDFDVARLAARERRGEAGALHRRRFVGRIVTGGERLFEGAAQCLGGEHLRRLGGELVGAVEGGAGATVARGFDRVGDGQGEQGAGARVAGGGGEQAIERGGGKARAGGVVDERPIVGGERKIGEGVGDGAGAGVAAFGEEADFLCIEAGAVGGGIVGGDDDGDGIDFGMGAKRGDGAVEQRPPVDGGELLRPAESRPAPGGDDKSKNATHRRADLRGGRRLQKQVKTDHIGPSPKSQNPPPRLILQRGLKT